jgi:hypothetical protein
LQSKPPPDLFEEAVDDTPVSQEMSLPSQPWKPSIVVVPLESQSSAEVSPQTAQSHLEQEQYWRAIQSEQQKNISRLLGTRSRDGVRSIPTVCHEVHRASTEASKHALLARNPGLLVRSDDNSLVFTGFNQRYISSSPSRKVFEFTIDFHGVDVRNSVQFLNSVIRYLKNASTLAQKKCIAHLIVGRGSHSIGGVAKLKPALISFLQRKGYKLSVLESEVTLHLE